MISDKLIYEKVVWIKYQSNSGFGQMVVLSKFYEKYINKFKRRLKDCNIYYMEECILTPNKLEEIENEIERVS